MYLKIHALVLRITDYNDRDSLLTVLTERHGKLTIKARGLRRKNSPLVAPCQLLSYAEFTLFEYRGMYTINEASSLELFRPLRSDLTKLSLGTYFAQVAETLSQEDMPNPELLSLVLNCLHALSYMTLPELQIKAVFEFRSACLAGYTPDLSGCCSCGNTTPDRFDVSAGCLECASCRSMECASCRSMESDGLRMPITPGVLNALRYIAFCEPKKLFGFRAGEETLKQLARVTETYLSVQLERGFSTLDFYKSLFFGGYPEDPE